jgi:hypothetical protein
MSYNPTNLEPQVDDRPKTLLAKIARLVYGSTHGTEPFGGGSSSSTPGGGSSGGNFAGSESGFAGSEDSFAGSE